MGYLYAVALAKAYEAPVYLWFSEGIWGLSIPQFTIHYSPFTIADSRLPIADSRFHEPPSIHIRYSRYSPPHRSGLYRAGLERNEQMDRPSSVYFRVFMHTGRTLHSSKSGRCLL